MSTVLSNPAEMMALGAPRVIHNDAELEIYTDALFRLTALENPSESEVEAIELLTLLVERYEQDHYSIPTGDPVSILRFIIEQQNLTQLCRGFRSPQNCYRWFLILKDCSTLGGVAQHVTQILSALQLSDFTSVGSRER
jgi:hypothetical protein